MTPPEARALANRLETTLQTLLALPARGGIAHTVAECQIVLRSLADQVEALQGQALSSVEREEYFAMKTKAGLAQALLGALADIAYSPDDPEDCESQGGPGVHGSDREAT